ncbi:hypothetical protein CYMTET_7703 [Cymbomonas tetramitiformis]|uniref:Uncharacterized protein n=1 Tax=Cymbomonas tetramitiformis TaxID=36881 RepID=A0AAE0LGU0_9CHLO|nr:hypothetical protein CYMTET_7703 [Cymbomonas tetramitiformis]
MGPTRALEPPPPSSEDLEDEAYQKLLQWNSHTAVSRVSHPRSPSSTASSSPKVVEKPPAVNIPKRIKPPTGSCGSAQQAFACRATSRQITQQQPQHKLLARESTNLSTRRAFASQLNQRPSSYSSPPYAVPSRKPAFQASRPASANPKVTALTASAASSASSSPASATTTVAVAAAHAVAPTFAKTRPSSANYARPSSAAVQRTPMSGASSPQRPTSAARALEGQDDSTPSQKSGARSPVPLLRNPDDFAHAAPPWPSRKSRSRKKGFQLETHDVKLPEYNAIEDRSLQQHFGKGIVQRDLRRSGVMTEEGGILDSETLRLKEYFEELSKEKERTEEVIKSIQSEHEKTFVERAKNEERARELGLQKVRMRQNMARARQDRIRALRCRYYMVEPPPVQISPPRIHGSPTSGTPSSSRSVSPQSASHHSPTSSGSGHSHNWMKSQRAVSPLSRVAPAISSLCRSVSGKNGSASAKKLRQSVCVKSVFNETEAAAAPVRTLELEKQIINNLNIELEYEQRCKQMLEHQATERYRIDTLFPLLSSPFREVNYAERVVDAFPPEDALGRGGPSVTAAGLDDALGSPVDSTNDAPPSPPHHSTAARHTYSPTPSPPDDFLAEPSACDFALAGAFTLPLRSLRGNALQQPGCADDLCRARVLARGLFGSWWESALDARGVESMPLRTAREAQQMSRQWDPGWEASVAEQEVLPHTVLDELQ